MKKAIFNFIYLTSILLSIVSIHEAFADRGPSVEPFTEVDIENTNSKVKNSGFNFDTNENTHESKRNPAGIVAKDPNSPHSPYSVIGPILFLLALPFAIWMVISKKLSQEKSDEKIDYYPKTFQFNPYKTDYQKNDDNDDDIDFPKAS